MSLGGNTELPDLQFCTVGPNRPRLGIGGATMLHKILVTKY
jgi:hypothetical protein